MLLVLPPSRGQTPAPDGEAPLAVADLTDTALTSARADVLTALRGSEHDVSRAPAAPAVTVFTGVLYAAADLPGLLRRRTSAAQRTRDQVLIASPLLGVARPTDRIPASRLTLRDDVGLGGLTAYWREHLAPVLNPLARGRVVVDVRSSEFTGMWRPPADATWVQVRVVQETGGQRRVVSHFAKHWRGLLVHHLLSRRGSDPTDLGSLVRATRALVSSGAILAVEHESATAPARPATLTLVVA